MKTCDAKDNYLSRNEISVVSNSGGGSSSGEGEGETGAQEAAEGQQNQEETHLEKDILSYLGHVYTMIITLTLVSELKTYLSYSH